MHSYPSTQVKAGGLRSTASGPHRRFQTRLGYLRKTLTYKERREEGREGGGKREGRRKGGNKMNDINKEMKRSFLDSAT